MSTLRAYCPECDRVFYVVDDPALRAAYRCPVCLTAGTVDHDDAEESDPAVH